MWKHGILGALLGAVLLETVSVNGDYIFTMSRSMQVGRGTKACLQLKDFLLEDQVVDGSYMVVIDLTLKLKYHQGPEQLDDLKFVYSVTSNKPNVKECFKVMGPSSVKYYTDTYEAIAVATVAYVSADGSTVEAPMFNKTADIKVYKSTVTTLIQTDKPIYKPGQVVKFRVMTLNQDFMADTKGYPQISVQTPGGLRVMQWDNVAAPKGLVSLEMPLSSDPSLGEWKIKVDLGDAVEQTQTFKVDEYVLPKFEVVVTPPSYLTPTTNKVTGKVCAKYTYGKPVKGRLSMKVCYNRGWYSPDDQDNERPCVDILEDIDGCYDFAVDSDVLGLANKTYSMWGQLRITASVTEAGTNIELSGESTGPSLTTSPISIRLEDNSGGFFKPGFPYKGKVIVTEPDGSAAIGEEIMVSGYYWGDKKYEKTFMTDQNGFINFVVDELTADVGSLRIEAASTVYKRHGGCYRWFGCYSWRFDVYVSDASKTIRQWYSPSDSYVYIPNVIGELECDSVQEIEVFYTTDPTEEHEFQVLVTAGEQVVSMDSTKHMYDGSLIDLNILSINPSQVLDDYVVPPTTTPSTTAPTSPNYPYYEVVEEEIVPEVFTPLGSAEGARKKRQAGNVLAHFKYNLEITADMSPFAKVLIYYIREDGEIVAATVDLAIKSCFRHQTSMNFDKEKARPGEDLDLTLQAEADATCFVGMVDKSVNLLGGTGSQLSPKKVFDEVRQYGSRRFWHSNWKEDEEHCKSVMAKKDNQGEESEYMYGFDYEPEGADSSTAFRDVSLWLISDAQYMFRPCKQRIYYTYYNGPMSLSGGGLPGGSGAIPESMGQSGVAPDVDRGSIVPTAEVEIRSFFPETWLWDMYDIGPDGATTVTTTIPDTITEWVGNALCTHPTAGLGVTPIIGVTAFQPFFVSLTMPYSAVRGETLPLKITVFNYLENCLAMEVNLAETEGLEITQTFGSSRQFCLCGGESETSTFFVIPQIIGEIDIETTAVSLESTGVCDNVILSEEGVGVADGVQRQLLVEAEGVPQDMTTSSYVCVEPGQEVTETQDITFPHDLVPGSERATVSVMGDIMGPTLTGLKNLLRMPYGCGEQNMASWAPNIPVLQYLKSTNQLSPKLEADAKSYMLSGYQRQMNYRHSDNSYSAFGENSWGNATGSSWLTAFVVKTMAQSAKYVTIDREDIRKSITFLVETQAPDDCFPRVGKVFSSYMKGGLGNNGENPAGLTAFMLIALLEADFEEGFDAIELGFHCLDTFVVSDVDTYTLSVMSYAYTLYNQDSQRRADILEELMNRKQTDVQGLMYWKREQEEVQPHPHWYWYRAPGAQVEMTAYVMLSLIGDGSDIDMSLLQPIVQWLTQQRNPYGGFSSTQDTVIAIAALAKFANLTYSGGESRVVVEALSRSFNHNFEITPSNSLLHQSETFNPQGGFLTSKIAGEGCALVQVNVKYNIYKDLDAGPAFGVTVKPYRSSIAKNNCAQRQLQICVSYLKPGTSNMAIAEVKMLTGWVPVETTLKDLVKSDQIQKYEVDKSYVQLYFDQVLNSQTCVSFEVEQEIRMNPKPAKVRVYDYYEADYTVTVPYGIDTTCGTKEEIPLDNEGLDCSIMQCREEISMKPDKLMTCPSCPSTLPDNTMLERIYCDSEVVYKMRVSRPGTYPMKVMSNIREKKKEGLHMFVHPKMLKSCKCPTLFPPSEGKVLVFSQKYLDKDAKKPQSVLDKDMEELVFWDETVVFKLTKRFEKQVRQLAGRGKLCEKLARRRRKAEKKKQNARRRRQ